MSKEKNFLVTSGGTEIWELTKENFCIVGSNIMLITAEKIKFQYLQGTQVCRIGYNY